jgi:hypothetical protein
MFYELQNGNHHLSCSIIFPACNKVLGFPHFKNGKTYKSSKLLITKSKTSAKFELKRAKRVLLTISLSVIPV